MKKKEIELLEKLISLPSFVDKKNNEKEVADFIFEYLKKFNFLKVTRQKISKDRSNIIATTGGSPKLFFAGHMDTVWQKNNNLSIKKEKGRLYGLGALDTKGGIAALLAAIGEMREVKNTSFLFYCDEEYHFKGMRSFLENNSEKVGEIGIVIEPTNLKIWNAHRGLIEISFDIEGVRGHAANKNSGVSATKVMLKLLNDLELFLNSFSHPVLGESTLNIAFLSGGLCVENKNDDNPSVDYQGNVIPDFARSVIEVRTASPKLDSEKILVFLKKQAKKYKVTITRISVKHNLGSLFTPENKWKNISRIVHSIVGRSEILPPQTKGYGDGQLLSEKKKIPVIYLGPSGEGAHSAGEYVNISSLTSLKEIYKKILEEYSM
ncbi:MAG: M20/M25/M40 family metallo-hydrolase [Candidatus Paceibacterota bacterium]|jgi:acetylornithine deacetylase/succinyl-diaminopimelate desuccinylase-like protein